MDIGTFSEVYYNISSVIIVYYLRSSLIYAWWKQDYTIGRR